MSAAPHEVILTFTESLEAAFSNFAVVDADGTAVSEGKAQVSDNIMRISLKPLNSGTYKVNCCALQKGKDHSIGAGRCSALLKGGDMKSAD